MSKFWMIARIGEEDEYVPWYGAQYIYHSKEDAEIKLLGLTKNNTWKGDRYYLLEVVATAKQIAGTDVYRVEPTE